MSSLPRPAPGEYGDFYRGYVELVPDGDILGLLDRQLEGTLAVLDRVPENRETFRYAPGKWSVREVVGHLIDVERVFAFRALAIAREDDVDLPFMDQDEWSVNSAADRRPLADLREEWGALRRANVMMFGSFDAEAGLRRGVASGYGTTVRSLAWMIAGHELWHRRLLEDSYLEAMP